MSAAGAPAPGTREAPARSPGYTARLARVMDAVQGRRPDRVPVALQTMLWWARYGDVSIRQVMYDFDLTERLAREAVLDFEPDLFAPPHQFTILGPAMEAVGFKQLQWPGNGVGDHQPYQYIDREYMTADEYDDYLFDPTGFFLSRYLPRVAGAAEGLQHLPVLPGLFYLRLVAGVRSFAHPKVWGALEALHRAGAEAHRLVMRQVAFVTDMEQRGFPLGHGAVSIAPFDLIGDYMRGAKGILTDMYRRRDKLLEALEKALVFVLRQTVATGKSSGNPFVFIPIHWAPDGFMSLAQFKTFWWPTFRKLLLGLIEHDLIPVPLWEADCTSRLETIADVPAGKVVYWFERTDLRRAREVLGRSICLRGNVPASMLTTGTPQQVDEYCRMLIETIGRDGGLILDGAFGIPDETPVGNARAMFDAVRKYGA